MSATLPVEPAAASALHAAYRALIEDRFGLRLTDHQARELEQKVMRVLALTHFAEPLELCRAFAAGWRTGLLQALVAELTIGETHFFRIRPQIDALSQVVLPDLLDRRAGQRKLRLWSAGCSTGEEPYTLAILLRGLLPSTSTWSIELLASDVNGPALETARRATYGEWSFRDTPPHIRQRYFSPTSKQQWQLTDSVRGMVRFAQSNLVGDPAPIAAPIDLIVCRNVTIYFSPEATRHVYRRFAEVLAPDGWLVLGPSDPAPTQELPIEPFSACGAILWRKKSEPVATRLFPNAPLFHVEPAMPQADAPAGPELRAPSFPAAALPTIEEVHSMAHGGDRSLALGLAEQLASAQPLNAEAHLVIGMLHLEDGAPEAALISLRRAAFLEPTNPLVFFSLGRAWALAGKLGQARAALLDARRHLAGVAQDEPLSGGGGLWAGELRQAVEAQLASAG